MPLSKDATFRQKRNVFRDKAFPRYWPFHQAHPRNKLTTGSKRRVQACQKGGSMRCKNSPKVRVRISTADVARAMDVPEGLWTTPTARSIHPMAGMPSRRRVLRGYATLAVKCLVFCLRHPFQVSGHWEVVCPSVGRHAVTLAPLRTAS